MAVEHHSIGMIERMEKKKDPVQAKSWTGSVYLLGKQTKLPPPALSGSGTMGIISAPKGAPQLV